MHSRKTPTGHKHSQQCVMTNTCLMKLGLMLYYASLAVVEFAYDVLSIVASMCMLDVPPPSKIHFKNQHSLLCE